MTTEERLHSARVNAYVAFSSAALDAMETRRKYGPKSREYAIARDKTDIARAAFVAASNMYRAHINQPQI